MGKEQLTYLGKGSLGPSFKVSSTLTLFKGSFLRRFGFGLPRPYLGL